MTNKRQRIKLLQRAMQQFKFTAGTTRSQANLILDVYELFLDDAAIGTPEYQGIAYFWSHEYRYPMRDLSRAVRRRIHHAWLAAGLKLDGESDEHVHIMRELSKSSPFWTRKRTKWGPTWG